MNETSERVAVFAARLRQARQTKGVSQAALAEAVGTRQSQISRIESGRRLPDSETLCRLADALELTMDYLVGRVDDPDPRAHPVADTIHRDMKSLGPAERELAHAIIRLLVAHTRGDMPSGKCVPNRP